MQEIISGPVTSSRSLCNAVKKIDFNKPGCIAGFIALNKDAASVGWKPTNPIFSFAEKAAFKACSALSGLVTSSRSLRYADKKKDF